MSLWGRNLSAARPEETRQGKRIIVLSMTATEAGAPEAIFSPDDPVETLWITSYQGEVLGEIFFGRMADQYDGADQSRKMTVMCTLERKTKEALVPALTRAGVSTEADPETVSGAEGLADAMAGVSWADFMGSLEAITSQYLALYTRIGELDPSEQAAADLLVAHELAIRDFGRKELAGEVDTSLDAVTALLHMRP
jgi:hypothetical protein